MPVDRPNVNSVKVNNDGILSLRLVQFMDFLMVGFHPFIDFVNTLPVMNGEAIEQIGDGGAFLNLLGRLELAGKPSLYRLTSADAELVAQEARRMREDFRALFFQLIHPNPDLTAANVWFSRLGSPQLISTGNKISLGYSGDATTDQLVPLLRSGLELLSSDVVGRIRKCANPDCVLWYLDTTKSGTRRWCSMAHCGNLEKARAFRQRKQTEAVS